MSKADSTVDYAVLEHCVRDVLGETSLRAMAVLRPLKVVLTNWPEGETKTVTLENHPDHPELGTREMLFGRELFIEQDDFMEVPVKKYQRMFPGNEVRLKGAYIVRCDECVKDADGNVTEVHCTVDLDSFSGSAGADRKIKGKTLHWVPAGDCIPFEARLYDPLLNDDHAVALKLATREEIAQIRTYALHVNEVLKALLSDAGVTLVDFKLEFGKTADGTLVLADEISPDTCRFWDSKTGEKLDKDRFRRDLGGVEDAYLEMQRRILES
jgi:glutamyl/glutaminyl-tRNA synthetase